MMACSDRSFTVDDIGQKQTFIVKIRSLVQTIDPPVTVRVKGHIDGKALVYIPNGPGIIDEGYTIKLEKGNFDRTLHQSFTYKRFTVVYQPITAKEGHIKIEVDAP